jgi:hypothetical protein
MTQRAVKCNYDNCTLLTLELVVMRMHFVQFQQNLESCGTHENFSYAPIQTRLCCKSGKNQNYLTIFTACLSDFNETRGRIYGIHGIFLMQFRLNYESVYGIKNSP